MNNICHDIEQNMNDFFDGCLRGKKRRQFFSHLKRCESCRDSFKKEKEIVEQLQSLPVSQCPEFVEKLIKASTINKREIQKKKEKKDLQWTFFWKPVTAGALAVAFILVFVLKTSQTNQETIKSSYTQEEIKRARDQAKYSLALVAHTLKKEEKRVVKDVVLNDISQTIKKSVSIVLPILGGDKK